LKRTREVQQLQFTIENLRGNLKNIGERVTDLRARIDQYTKDKRPVPQAFQDDLDRANADKLLNERQIEQKRKEIASVNQYYEDLKKRYVELTASSATVTQKIAVPPPSASNDKKAR
jgi:predicted RNase H-like nuclease (RuvC/YqgF family)